MRLILLIWLSLLVFFGDLPDGEQQFSYLAKSFIGGNAYFMEMPGSWGDVVQWQGRHYWPLGLLPVLVMMPGAALMQQGVFLQVWPQTVLVLATAIMIYRFARKKGFSAQDSRYWVLAFVMGSAYLGVSLISWSWYFSQIITVFLMWAIWSEFWGKRRYGLIGLGLAGIWLTRIPAALIIVFFVGYILMNENKKLFKLIQLGLPMGVGFLMWGGYNWIRFSNFFDQGYALSQVPAFIQKACSYGLFSWVHIPANLYYLFLASPKPVLMDGFSKVLKAPFIAGDPWGISVFITSPYILKLAMYNYKDKISWLLMAAIIIIAIPILSYCGIGFRQFGYRYGLDFFTVAFWLLMHKMSEHNEKLSKRLKALILIGAVLNFFLFMTVYFVYV